MELSSIERRYIEVDVTATLASGSPVTLTEVGVALLPMWGKPTPDTEWLPSVYADGVATLLVTGSDAAVEGGIVVPAPGADLWIRNTDTPEVAVTRVGRINVV